MGKSWKNPLKQANAAKKGAQISKLAKEIAVAARLGGGDPDSNSRLRLAIHTARAESVSKDTIQRAIQKGVGQLEDGGKVIEEILYEGYGPHQLGVLVECQTDNRARSASNIRFLFKKYRGQMGEQGSVIWMFQRIGWMEGVGPKGRDFDPEEEAIEAGANEVEKNQQQDSLYSFYTDSNDLDQAQRILVQRGWIIQTCELSYKAKNKTEGLSEDQLKDIYEFLDAIDNDEDCARIHTTL